MRDNFRQFPVFFGVYVHSITRRHDKPIFVQWRIRNSLIIRANDNLFELTTGAGMGYRPGYHGFAAKCADVFTGYAFRATTSMYKSYRVRSTHFILFPSKTMSGHPLEIYYPCDKQSHIHAK
jgi:hypothetical protein